MSTRGQREAARTQAQIERDDAIRTALQSPDGVTVDELADRLGVAVRTATVWLTLRREEGLIDYTVDLNRGANGGWRKVWRWTT